MLLKTYPIGTPGIPWGAAERRLWLSRQRVQRSYHDDVVAPLLALFTPESPAGLQRVAECFTYGVLDYQPLGFGTYPLYAVKSKNWDPAKPFFLVTGGVHGYESSGVLASIRFIGEQLTRYAPCANFLILVCVSPWGYETVNRWNPHAVDPNRTFLPRPTSAESQSVIALLATLPTPLLHIDLHETTDTDASEYRPAKAARDAQPLDLSAIPDGFYLAADQNRLEPAFQARIIEAVSRVTPIAPADAQGLLLGKPLAQHGVIQSPKREMGICSGWTDARYVTTTEVYPDSLGMTAECCIQAQLTAIDSGFDFALSAV
jgi:hypothetical protein